jgi:hypothetical protein
MAVKQNVIAWMRVDRQKLHPASCGVCEGVKGSSLPLILDQCCDEEKSCHDRSEANTQAHGTL